MWVGPGSGTSSYREARLFRSADHGASWTRTNWAFSRTDRLIMPTICQFGRDYSGAPDRYVYHYFIRLQGHPSQLSVHKPGQVDLARVPTGSLLDRSGYEFFAGLNADGRPKWTADPRDRRSVFEDPRGVGWCISVSYDAPLKRYLLSTEHDATFRRNLGILDAPQPWGPWTTVT